MGRYDPPPILPPSPALGKPNKDVSGRSFELRVVLFHSWASPPERIKPNCYTRNCWRCDYQKSQRGLGLAILICGWPWSEAQLGTSAGAFVVNKRGRTERSCAEFDIESQQRRQNSQIGPSYFAAVPKQPVAGSDGASRRLEEWIRCGLAPAFPRLSVLANPWPTPGACASARSKQNSFAESGVTTSGSTQRYDPGIPAELSPLAFLRMDSARAIAARLVPPLFPCPR